MNARAFLIPVLLVGLPAQTAAQADPSALLRAPMHAEWFYEIDHKSVIRVSRHHDSDWQKVFEPKWTEEELTGLRGPRREKGALISIPSNPDTLRYQWSEIDRIEMLTGHHTGEGLALGGLIGIGLVALVVHGMNEGVPFPGPMLFVMIAAVPATTGAIIGSGIPKWDPVF